MGESAIFVDVESAVDAHNYARALAATGAHDKAAFELESALVCEGKPDGRGDRARAARARAARPSPERRCARATSPKR